MIDSLPLYNTKNDEIRVQYIIEMGGKSKRAPLRSENFMGMMEAVTVWREEPLFGTDLKYIKAESIDN